MQPNGSGDSKRAVTSSQPPTAPISRRSQPRSTPFPKPTGKSEPMRLTDYRAVRKFIDSYNKSASPSKESGIRDVLDRLTKMTLQSNIPDTNRVDQFRSNKESQKKSSPSSLKQTDLNIDKTRMYAAQARTSLMTFAYCHTRHLQEKAIDILIEALETNTLSHSTSETEILFQILDEARLALEATINSVRNQRMYDAASDTDGRLFVDLEMERILKCIDLIMHRIEYICDMDALILLPTQADTLNILKEELGFFQTDDPSIVQLISSFHDSIDFVISRQQCKDTEEAAATLSVALSFSAQIIRMAPPSDIREMSGAFIGVLETLEVRQEWHLGKKFLSILGSAAMYHIEACRLLISVIPVLGELRWQWMHHAIMHLGAVALMAESSQIKKVALEDGLLVFVSYDDNAARQSVQEDVDSQSLSWTARAASAVCLNALLSYRKSSPMALLAHAAISSRKAIESHPIVSRNLSLSAPPFFRLSVLFKYTGRSLSENYIDSQNQLSAMRSYVKQVSTTRQYHSKSIMRSEGQLPSQPTVPLSTAPYHSNYKQHTLQEERAMMSSFMTLPSGLSTKPSSLTSSYTCFKADAPVLDLKSISQPLTGTANRRKLYSGKEVDEEEEEEDDDESEQPKSDAGQGVDIVVNDFTLQITPILPKASP